MELLKRAPTVIALQPPAPVVTHALVPYDSSDDKDDEVNPNDEQYNLHVMDSLWKYVIYIYTLLLSLSNFYFHLL